MARILGSTPADRWERFVIAELKRQLPADWSVISGVSWSRRGPTSGYSYVRDGQADVVVLAPSLGMIILEVKGSKGFRIGADGRWYRLSEDGETVINTPPPEQACSNMHELVDLVIQKGVWDEFPGLYAFAVVYPQGKLQSQAPTTFDHTTLIQESQMHQLRARLEEALEVRGRREVGLRFNNSALNEVSRILTSQPFKIVKADTSLAVRDDIDGIDILTRQQFAALQGIFSLSRVEVSGPAGSGKTVLAIWLLHALAEEGKRVAYVCFNRNLAEALRRKYAALTDHIENVDRLFRRIVDAAGQWPQQHVIQRDTSKFFREDLPGLVIDAVVDWPAEQRYDAIIIDEGQDFSDAQILALLELLPADSGRYVYFSDRRQDLFQPGGSGSLGAEVHFTLKHNCRNTERINAHTNRLLQGEPVPPMPGVPIGVQPVVRHCKDSTAMAAQAWQLAHEWAAAGGGVVILSPFTLDKSCMASSRKGHGMQLVDDIALLETRGTVYFSTIRSFKGIEAASVILVDCDIPRSGSHFSNEDLYVACTRPKARLALLTEAADCARWLAG